MKVKQNPPLRLKINKTPILLKTQSDKDARILVPNTSEKKLLISTKNEYPKINIHNTTSIKNNSSKNFIEEEKKDYNNNFNLGKTYTINKIIEGVDKTTSNIDFLNKSSKKNMVLIILFILIFIKNV